MKLTTASRMAVIVALGLCLMTMACGKSGSEAAADTPALPDYVTRQAMMAIATVESTLEGMKDGGGFQAWTAEKAAAQLIPVLNTLVTPEPGEPRTPGPKFKYVANQATGPWQVSIEVVGDSLLVKAYGPSIERPLQEKTIPVGPY